MPFYERQPYIQPLYQIISEVMCGEIRVPRFQRPGTEVTWSPELRGNLLDSLYRGFPVGTILLWSAKHKLRTLDMVGGCKIPQSDQEREQRLLLDGHQRLSTLVQILGAGLEKNIIISGIKGGRSPDRTTEQERWVFELQPKKKDEPSRERFILLKTYQYPTNTQVPLEIVLDRSSLNNWIRQNQEYLDESMIVEADALRDRLREYSIPVAVLVTDSLQEATESFKRINSSGVKMTDFNMFSALAYNSRFDPQKVFVDCRNRILEPIGWQEVADLNILRVCAGLIDKHPVDFKVEQLSLELKDKKTVIEDASHAIKNAAKILRKKCGIHGPKALPYAWQLITIAIYIAHKKRDCIISKQEENEIAKWFWLTTYGEVFSGSKSSTYNRSSKALKAMIQGDSWNAMERDVTQKIEQIQRFDFRAVRSKACALAMARHQDKGNLDGNAHRALASGVSSMGLLYSQGKRNVWWHLVVTPSINSITDYRDVLTAREQGEIAQKGELLAEIGIPVDEQGTAEQLLQARRQILLKKEAEFIVSLGLDSSAYNSSSANGSATRMADITGKPRKATPIVASLPVLET